MKEIASFSYEFKGHHALRALADGPNSPVDDLQIIIRQSHPKKSDDKIVSAEYDFILTREEAMRLALALLKQVL